MIVRLTTKEVIYQLCLLLFISLFYCFLDVLTVYHLDIYSVFLEMERKLCYQHCGC